MEKRYKILIVEDKPAYSEPLRRCINKDDGFEVLAVTDSVSDAFKLVKTGLPDAIIVDMQLAEGDGFDLLNQIHNAKENLSVFPYILVTTKFSSDTVMEILCDGLADYVFSKRNLSYSPEQILKHLRLISKHFFRNRKPETKLINTVLEREAMIRKRIANELNQYYLNQGSQGIEFLIEIIFRVMHLPKNEKVQIGHLYIEIGKLYNTTPNTIDMSIRRLLNGAFLRTAQEDLERLYTPYVDIGRGAPRNKEFIIYVADKIRNENL